MSWRRRNELELQLHSRGGKQVTSCFQFVLWVEIQPGEESGLLRVEASIGRSLWLWSLKHVLTKSLDVLHQHRWTILRSPPEVEWLTSDSPVVRLNYHDAQNYDFGCQQRL